MGRSGFCPLSLSFVALFPPSHRPAAASLRFWLPVVFLTLATAAVWAWQNDRLDPARWGTPTDYTGDSLEILTRFKAVTEGEQLPFVRQTLARLGAPFGADWSRYPLSDKPMILFLGLVAKAVGVNEASNFALLLAHVLSALAFYGCARFLRASRIWSIAGALLFAFTFQLARGLPHLWLTFAYTVPCAVLASWLVGSSRRLRWRSPEAGFCLVLSVVLGASNPYNLFFFLQLMVLAIIAQAIADRRPANIGIGAACVAVAIGSFALFNLDVWIYSSLEKTAPLMARNYGGTELYALKPIELVVAPPGHHLALLSDLGYRYLRWSNFKGEPFDPYLGFIGIAGFVWIFADLAKRILRRRPGRIPAHGLQIGWILLYSAVGGLNSILSLYAGLHIFRATNRFSIFISAIALLFLASRLSVIGRRWPLWVSGLLASLAVAIGLYDELPKRASSAEENRIAARVKSDRDFGQVLERTLPRGGMVFQLPVRDFPESGRQYQLGDYEHFRPYLATDTLRFSYGVLKHHSPAQWQKDYALLEPAKLALALEEAGLSALYIDRRGYADQGEGLIAALRAAGRTSWLENGPKEIAVLPLHPSASPRPPLAHNVTYGVGWNFRIDDDPRVLWTSGDVGHASYFNPYPRPILAALRFSVVGVSPRPFSFRVNGRERFNAAVGASPTVVGLQPIALQPGSNRFEFTTPAPAVRLSEDLSLRSLGIGDLEFHILPASLPAP